MRQLAVQEKLKRFSLETMLREHYSAVRQLAVQVIGAIELKLVEEGRLLDEDWRRYILWVESRLPYDELLFEQYLDSSEPEDFILRLKQKVKAILSGSVLKLAIKVYEVASVNAARGLIKALGLDRDNVIILYDEEIDLEQAQRFFPGYSISAFSGFTDKQAVRVRFLDDGRMKVESSGDTLSFSLPYTPFKFNLPEGAPEEESSRMREFLGIGKRKVIVIGSPSDREFSQFIQAYNSLYDKLTYARRPLLIIGFRQRRDEGELKLLGSLSGQSIAVRSDVNAVLPNVADNNVLILNTAGELLKMYALADIAIVGNDRNIFEPASQKAAVLYFEGSWQNNKDAKEVLVEAGAAKGFSKENLERLINSPDEVREIGREGLKAVEVYRNEVEAKAVEFALQIIWVRRQLREKLITGSSPIVNTSYENFPGAQNAGRQINTDAVPASSVSSFAPGGIDFRFLPIVTQAMTNLSAGFRLNDAALARLNSLNLDEELGQMQRMVEGGIIPSAERIREYVQASCVRGNTAEDIDKVILCISDILRLEEERCVSTEPVLRDILIVLEANRSTKELKKVFLGAS